MVKQLFWWSEKIGPTHLRTYVLLPLLIDFVSYRTVLLISVLYLSMMFYGDSPVRYTVLYLDRKNVSSTVLNYRKLERSTYVTYVCSTIETLSYCSEDITQLWCFMVPLYSTLAVKSIHCTCEQWFSLILVLKTNLKCQDLYYRTYIPVLGEIGGWGRGLDVRSRSITLYVHTLRVIVSTVSTLWSINPTYQFGTGREYARQN